MSLKIIKLLIGTLFLFILISIGIRAFTKPKSNQHKVNGNQTTSYPSGIYFIADHETKNLSQWTQDGSIDISGLGNSWATTDQAHSGKYSAALKLKLTGGWWKPSNGVRLSWRNKQNTDSKNAQNLPDEAYYSAWYYFPQIIKGPWFNIMQWKQAAYGFTSKNYKGDHTRPPVHTINAQFDAKTNQMYLEVHSKIDDQNKFIQPGTQPARAAISIPTKQWIHIECFYRWTKTPTGQLTCWQDGVQIWDLTSIRTEFDYPFTSFPREWTVNSYAEKTQPLTHTLYIDDAIVSTTRLGPLYQLPL